MADTTVGIIFTGDPTSAVAASKAVENSLGNVRGQAEQTSGFLTRVGQGVSSTGVALTKTLTPAALAVAAAGKIMFTEWDTGFDTIRAQTGATGEELESLGDSMERVAGRVTAPMSRVGEVIAELNSRLGLTDEPLEDMAKRFLDLERMNMPATVENVSRAFGDWSVKTEDQADTLDKFFRAAQGSGVSIDQLTQLVVRFGAPLRQMGFSLEEATAIAAKFEKEGVNTELVLGSMRIALGKLAREGKEPVEAFRSIVRQIESTGSAAKANRLAIELFGARAGPDMAAAIREGRFAIDDYIKQIEGGEDTIAAAAEDTLDLGDKITMLRNRVVGVVGPYGEMIAVVAGGLAALGPTLFAIGQMLPLLGKLAGVLRLTAAAQWLLNLAMSANPILLVVVAIAALVAALILAWQHSETFRAIVTGAFDAVRAAASAVLNFFATHWKTVAVLISGPFAPIVLLATDAFGVRSALIAAFTAVLNFVRRTIESIVGFFAALPGRLLTLVGALIAVALTPFREAFGAAASFVRARVDDVVSFFTALPQRLAHTLGPLAGQAIEPLRRLFGLVSAAVEAINKAVQWLRENAVRIFKAVVDGVTGPLHTLAGALQPVERMLGQVLAFMEGIRDKAGDVIDAIGKVASAAGKIGGIVGAVLPGRQHGGPVQAGQAYLVGEAGPEVFLPGSAGRILPNSALRSPRAAGAGGSAGMTLVLQVHGDFVGDRAYVEQLARLIKPELPRVAMYESRV